MTSKSGKKTVFYVLLLSLLAAAAVAAAYFIYFAPYKETSSREVPARINPPTGPVSVTQRTKGQLTSQEIQALRLAALPKEYRGLFDQVPSEELLTPLPDLEKVLATSVPYEAALKEPIFGESTTAPPGPVLEPLPPLPGPTVVQEEAKSPTQEKDRLAAKTAERPGTKPGKPAEGSGLEAKVEGTKPATPGQSSPKAADREKSPAGSKTGLWVANLLSTTDKDQARRLFDALLKVPYQVYAYQTEVRGQTWYRVRIGFFNSRQEAEKAGQALARDHQLSPPWIVQPGPEEVTKHKH